MIVSIVEDAIHGPPYLHSEWYVHPCAFLTICFIILSFSFALPGIDFNLPGWAFFPQISSPFISKSGDEKCPRKKKKKQRSRKKRLSQKKKKKKKKNIIENLAEEIVIKPTINKKKNMQGDSNKIASVCKISKKKKSSDLKPQKSKIRGGKTNDMPKSSKSNSKFIIVDKVKILKSSSCVPPRRRSRYQPTYAEKTTSTFTKRTVRDRMQPIQKRSNFLSKPSFNKKKDRKLKKKEIYCIHLAKFRTARAYLKSRQRKTNIYHYHEDVCSISSCHFAIVPGTVNVRAGMIVTISVTLCSHIILSSSSSSLSLNSMESGKSQWNNLNPEHNEKCTCPCPSCSLNDLYISTHGSPSDNQRNIGRKAVNNSSRSNNWSFIRPIPSDIPEPQSIQHTPYAPWEVDTETRNWYPHARSQLQPWYQLMTSQPCKYGPYCNREDCRFAHPESNYSMWWHPNHPNACSDHAYMPNLGAVHPDGVVYH